jgi:DNA/RNA endonuclease YhcR with UshA esterase domain
MTPNRGFANDFSQFETADAMRIAIARSPGLSDIEGKKVKIAGRIEMYKGKPEIRINAASQFEAE